MSFFEVVCTIMFVLACTTDSVTVRRDLVDQLASGLVAPSRRNDCNRIRTTPGRFGVHPLCLLLMQASTNKSDTCAGEYGKVRVTSRRVV